VAIGLIGAVIAARAMAGMLFGVSPIDLATFAVVTTVLAVVALAGCVVPARRAMRADPVVALRG